MDRLRRRSWYPAQLGQNTWMGLKLDKHHNEMESGNLSEHVKSAYIVELKVYIVKMKDESEIE